MRRFKSFIVVTAAASAVAIGGLAMTSHGADPATPNDAGQLTTPTGVNTATPTDTTGNNPNAAAPDADNIRKAVVEITEDAVTKGDFHKLTKNLVEADYDRLKGFKPADNFATLDGRIDQFRKDWKAKYNEDFGFKSTRTDALNDQFARITQGEIGEARTASGKEMPSAEPQNVKGGTPEDLKASGVNQTDANSNRTFGGDTKREAGRNIASFTIKGNAEMSAKVEPGQTPPMAVNAMAQKELAVPMIHQLPDSWHVDIPDNIDGQRLEDNLLKHLTTFDEDRANWPTDKNQAYREVTRQVMTALMESGT